jgi:hypothetical protein
LAASISAWGSLPQLVKINAAAINVKTKAILLHNFKLLIVIFFECFFLLNHSPILTEV